MNPIEPVKNELPHLSTDKEVKPRYETISEIATRIMDQNRDLLKRLADS